MATLRFDSRNWPSVGSRRYRSFSSERMGLWHGVATGETFVVHDSYKTSTGTRVLHAIQYYRGLKVYRSSRVLKMKGRKLVGATPPLFRLPRSLKVLPDVTCLEALDAIVAFLKKRKSMGSGVRVSVVTEDRHGTLIERPTTLLLRYGFKEPVRMHLEVFPIPNQKAELVWITDLKLRNGMNLEAAVRARGGAEVLFLAQTNSCARSFNAAWSPTPGVTAVDTFPIPPFARPDGSNATVALEWLRPSGTGAAGPNAACYVDWNGKPGALGSARVDNAFVWCNLLHDLFQEFGFDSAHHAFDKDDPLKVQILGDVNVNAGAFDNELDGDRPSLLLYGSPSGPSHHAGYDSSIVVHEYTHGVMNRLIGGNECRTPFLEDEGMGFAEGMCDYFALTLINYLERVRVAQMPPPRPTAVLLKTFGGVFTPGGIRSYGGFVAPYAGQSKPHQIGRFWCAAFLDGRQLLAATHDVDVVDRFLWSASIDCFKSMAPLCKKSLALDLAHARSSLVAAIRGLEATWQMAGAANAIQGAFVARNL